MKMLVVNARFLTQDLTGVQRFAIEICKQLIKQYPNISFVSPKNIVHQEIADLLNVKTIGKFKGHLWEQIDLPVYFKKLPAQAVLLNLANTAPLFINRKIVTVHDLAFLINPEWFSKIFYYYYRFLIPGILKNNLAIFTVSEFSKKEILKYFKINPQKVIVIYNAVSEKLLRTSSASKFKKNNSQFILAVSSIEPRKNLKSLILAYQKINNKNIKLLLVGKENSQVFSQSDSISANSAIEENIKFTGYLSDEELNDLYKTAEVFVYPSFYEGFGLPPLEAMANGCPVMVSNTTSMPEICGEAAIYFDPYNSENIAEKLDLLINNNDLKKQLIEKGSERVKTFSWAHSAKTIIETINNIK